MRTPKGMRGESVQFTLPREYKAELERMIADEYMSMSSWVRRLVMAAISERLRQDGKAHLAQKPYRPLVELEMKAAGEAFNAPIVDNSNIGLK